MAIHKEQKTKVSQNLYLVGEYEKHKPTRFLFDFRYLKKRYRKLITISDTSLDKRTRIARAKHLLEEFKEEIRQDKRPDEQITVDQLFKLYMDQTTVSERWRYDQKRFYTNHISPYIGTRRAYDVKPFEIKRIISDMDKKGYAKEYQVRVKRILEPMYKFAILNDILKDNPLEKIHIKVPTRRKTITNPGEKFVRLYTTITTLFRNDPYYQAIFLFGLFGRRKNEVLHLRWEDVDLINGYYWIQKTKAGVKQRYKLPPIILDLLVNIPDEKSSYIFKSPLKPDQPITEIKRQIKKVREASGIEDYNFHRMRDILVSALYERGIPAPILSNLLGHLNPGTLKHYLSIDTYQSSEEGYKEVYRLLGLEAYGL